MHVIEDNRRFARSERNAPRGVTLKVSPKRLTLSHFRVSSQCQGSSHSRLNLLRSRAWFLPFVLGYRTTLRNTVVRNRTPQKRLSFTVSHRKIKKNAEKELFKNDSLELFFVYYFNTELILLAIYFLQNHNYYTKHTKICCQDPACRIAHVVATLHKMDVLLSSGPMDLPPMHI